MSTTIPRSNFGGFLWPTMTEPSAPQEHLRYFLLYKPYGFVSQFTGEGNHRSLREFGPFPRDVYPVGRLDADSEGLILLTNDNRIKHRLTDPKFGHARTYLVEIERVPEEKDLQKIRDGITLRGTRTLPAKVSRLVSDPVLPNRTVPIRFRKNVPTCWIELTLREGKNRQVRRMTAAIGHPTLRLIRTKMGFLTLTGLEPGEQRELTSREISRLKKTLGIP